MQLFKFIFLGIYLFASSMILADEVKNPFVGLLDNIDREEDEILSTLYAVKLEQEKRKAEEQRKKEKVEAEQRRLAEVKLKEEEEKRRREKEKEIQRVNESIKVAQQRMAELQQKANKVRLKKEKEDRKKLAEKKKKRKVSLANKKKKKKKKVKAKSHNNYIKAHIDLSNQQMKVFRGQELLYKWRVSTARRGYVTPVGSYRPKSLERMHYSRKYHNSPMPHSVFFKGGYAIHGTRSISRLGKKASHGCVRLHPKNAKKLYGLIREYGKKNTVIKIVR